jgi:5-formyltetrahydrofolate cyclo-ligase
MAAPHFPDLVIAKQRAREVALARRTRCDPAVGAALARHVLTEALPEAGAIVSGFWPLDGEIDLLPLLHALYARGHQIVLPETPPRSQPLTFRLWQPGEQMRRGRFGTLVPSGPVLVPDFLLVPLLAFDRQGRRLGYGGGYYDRTLAALPGRPMLGCAFAAQELDEVPAGPYDARLPAVATEHGIITCGG